ncbi:hypothetical protein GCK72_003137 [Caenorhabditis remanei]|uniref:F-box domain-containing protein n=1 Tax=Caenorhabditis remanei TaxID=31234 RepID=A0A6A5HVT5_CAERE|nr:hypothetical protein GCK72_003137 [Caenorhabditis remanei]KAF1771311.1 hypothetical protein GCK72_003137 [Caenorhabditis remanei]
MSSPFPLLRLPRLVLSDVFKLLNIEEKFKLSLCSKKISTQIINARLYSENVTIDLNMLYQRIEVSSENNKDTLNIFNYYDCEASNNPDIHQYRIEERTVPVFSAGLGITLYWKNLGEGFLSVIRYLLKIFRCKFSISNDYNSDLYGKAISELFDLQVEFKKLVICFNLLKNQHLLWNKMSRNLGLVEDLNLSSIPGPLFRPVFTSWPQKISITSSYWFTLESLLTCTCNTITLGWSLLENKDLDKILKNWKTGGFPNLKCLKIHGESITNNGTMILGMSFRELNGKVIQTDDGSKKATIKLRPHNI